MLIDRLSAATLRDDQLIIRKDTTLSEAYVAEERSKQATSEKNLSTVRFVVQSAFLFDDDVL